MTDALAAPKVQDASENSPVDHRSISQRPPKREAYVTMDALKNFITTMTDTILKQVTKQVKKIIEAMSSIRPLPTFDYVSTADASRPTATFPLSHFAEVMK